MIRYRFVLPAALAWAASIWGASPALAACYYNGQQYEENDRVGNYVCQDGRWVSG
jgi:hypothetical protein